MIIDPSTLRLFWAVFEDTQSHDLLTLSDTALVKTLVQEVSRRILLSGEEVCMLYDYIDDRTQLLRDLAEFKWTL
ncbi:MAG: hypothetical protein VKL59_08625 [Nostocaceae cyanobacterium]|nr:hypothetical protein [Nostocaceae cyanobacterium]